MRIIIAGLGVQGHKRRAVAGTDCVAIVDPVHEEADYQSVEDVPLNSYDACLVCTPDEVKVDVLTYLLGNAKHVLVEKPLLTHDDETLQTLKDLAAEKGVVCYTAYNHRFEPHFMAMKQLIDSGELGEIYSIRMFYGNGTARLVRDSVWRDQAAGVLPDLGSHLLDTLRYWLGEDFDRTFETRGAFCHENKSFDHVIIGSNDGPAIQLETSMLSWRNHFTCDVLAEKGSAHIESLCKWGPSTFIHRTRILPAGRPPETSTTLVEDDPTWKLEYAHFKQLCASGGPGNLENDLWLNETLRDLAQQVGIPSVLPEETQS